jgi:hypothetical protein
MLARIDDAVLIGLHSLFWRENSLLGISNSLLQ